MKDQKELEERYNHLQSLIDKYKAKTYNSYEERSIAHKFIQRWENEQQHIMEQYLNLP